MIGTQKTASENEKLSLFIPIAANAMIKIGVSNMAITALAPNDQSSSVKLHLQNILTSWLSLIGKLS